MIPKNAIKKAIENGWRDPFLKSNPNADIPELLRTQKNFPAIWQQVACDSTFWKSLCRDEPPYTHIPDAEVEAGTRMKLVSTWKHAAHTFYDLYSPHL